MTNKVFNEKVANNFGTLKETGKGAKLEIKEKRQSIMYFVNILNREAKKNAEIEGVNLKELSLKVQRFARLQGFETATGFNAYLFTKVNNVSCYKKVTHRKQGAAFAISEDIVTWQPVKLSEIGLINAYLYILGQAAKAADNVAKQAAKAARKAENSKQAEARKALKKQQAEALKAFQRGEIPLSVFAEIMKQAA